MKRDWFRKQTAVPKFPEVQLRSGERHPFGMLSDYVPLRKGEMKLYRAVREAVPVVDAAIYKLIRKEYMMSTMRIMIMSTLPPKYPAMDP